MVLCSEVMSGFWGDGEEDCQISRQGLADKECCRMSGGLPIWSMYGPPVPECAGCDLRTARVHIHWALGCAEVGLLIVWFQRHGNQDVEQRNAWAEINRALKHLNATMDSGVCE